MDDYHHNVFFILYYNHNLFMNYCTLDEEFDYVKFILHAIFTGR